MKPLYSIEEKAQDAALIALFWIGLGIGSLLLLCGCAVSQQTRDSYWYRELQDPLHYNSGVWFLFRKVSPPAYPPCVAKEPVLWFEGGHVWLFDQNGVREVK